MSSTNTNERQPLHEFDRLTPSIYLSKRPAAHESDVLIVLTTWMAAASKHIAKYTDTYRERFPTAQILIVRFSVFDGVLMANAQKARQSLAPAMAVINAHVKRTKRLARPSILLHSYSNGGGTQLTRLSTYFKEEHGYPIPARILVLDSSPGGSTYWRSYAAIVVSWPKTLFFRIFKRFLTHLILSTYLVIGTILRLENPIAVMARRLNDKELFDARARRVYLYSKADQMIAFEDVEAHAEQAQRNGWAVNKVRFEKSPHAGHILEDKSRYWDAVEKAWDQEQGSDFDHDWIVPQFIARASDQSSVHESGASRLP